MIGQNTQGHQIPPGLHFKDKAGHFSFRDKVAPYLQGFTTRVCSNVLTPHGGGAGSNNATETRLKVNQKHSPVRKAPGGGGGGVRGRGTDGGGGGEAPDRPGGQGRQGGPGDAVGNPHRRRS